MNPGAALTHLRIGSGAVAIAEACEIFNRAERPRDPRMAEGSGLEAMRQVITGRPHLVGESVGQQLFAPPQYPLMGTEELVSRRDQHVAAQVLDIDPAMRRILYGIDIDESARLLCLSGEALHIVDGAGAVRGKPERHKPGSVAQYPGQC